MIIKINPSRYLFFGCLLLVLAILLIIKGGDKYVEEHYAIAIYDFFVAFIDLVIAIWNLIIHFNHYND